MSKADNICEVKNCRTEGYLLYFGNETCKKHWEKHCDESDKFDLKEEFDIVEISRIKGLTLGQSKVFLEMNDDLLLTIYHGRKKSARERITLRASDYDEETIDDTLSGLTRGEVWMLEKV